MEKNVCGSDYKGFHTDWEQPGLRDRSGVATQRPQRGRALFDNKLKSTTRADGANGRQLSFHQGEAEEGCYTVGGLAGWCEF